MNTGKLFIIIFSVILFLTLNTGCTDEGANDDSPDTNGRDNIDDITDAKNLTDSDGDGVEDVDDEYPDDPYSTRNGTDSWILENEVLLGGKDLRKSFTFTLENKIDFLVWDITSEEPVDLLVIDPEDGHVFHDVSTNHKNDFEIEMEGTWELQLVYNSRFPPRTTINGVAYQKI